MKVITESWPWRRKFSRRFCRDWNPRPFDYESGAQTTELSPLHKDVHGDWLLWSIHTSKSCDVDGDWLLWSLHTSKSCDVDGDWLLWSPQNHVVWMWIGCCDLKILWCTHLHLLVVVIQVLLLSLDMSESCERHGHWLMWCQNPVMYVQIGCCWSKCCYTAKLQIPWCS